MLVAHVGPVVSTHIVLLAVCSDLAQGQLNEVMEKERDAAEKEATLLSRVASLEAQVKSLRTDKAKLSAELEAERVKLAATEDGSEKYVCSVYVYDRL